MTERDRPSGAVIEFLGVPGVGKTTIARRLATDLRSHGYRAAFVGMDSPAELSRRAKLFRHLGEIAPYLIAEPRQAWRSLALLRYFPQPALADSLSRLRYWLRTLALARRWARTAEVAILDQGYFQGLFSWALPCRGFDPRVLSAALEVIPRPELLVVVTASAEVVRARLRGRNASHRKIDRCLLGDERWLDISFRLITQIEQSASWSRCSMLRVGSGSDDPGAALSGHVLAMLAERSRSVAS
jgi:thymidylate kinase